MKVYLDNSATTKPRDEVINEMILMLKDEYGNPSSLHRMGLEVEKKIEASRKIIADFLKVRKEEITFTSGGTESNNIAIQSIVNKFSRNGKHIITTKIEHPSVLNVFKHYQEKGYDVTYLDVDENGVLNLEQLEESITNKTILLSVMSVNNEIGTIQPIEKIRNIINSKNKNVKLHVDGVQAFGKIDIDINKLGIDAFTFSGHKVHGPKGIGGIFIKKGLNLESIAFGGEQEKGLRSGTENVPGIIGLGKAVEILEKNFKQEKEKILELKNYFYEKVKGNIENIKINSFLDDLGTPHIINISFIGVRGEVLIHYLEDSGIYVSTSSACSSKGKGKSHVLVAIGLSNKEIDGAVRFSFSYNNTFEELDYVVEKLKYAVEDIRKITMR
ncbi:cysteine desulfurase IscS [Gottschalkia acidurici 9a]|uniref:Cysteine desulfurase IscS n=1 Tax=Gottschalkia acidurici (strain ATCC 7906 / DSM 604 / BCRC 14475 / CIP 104303 / KCTC 5404 / NCIMB 10678 / 9a) TaxID=1128398 RepID=K0AXQ8_GOTA9|nr:cysteine desulfurase family protein [Gottschalkia acidurici]AFS77959.1 cysteine desulfurase IscS [Gottschalkia acidurici 9a]